MKQTLDTSHVGQASDKAASVRDLHRTSGPIPNQFNLEARKDLAAFSAIAGILCERSDWSTPLGDAFDACIADNKGPRGLDLGCALSDGSFEFDWRGGEFTIDKSQTANALIYFAMRLLRRWQAMATVPAIDYSAYEVPCSTNPGRFRPDEVSPSGFGVSRPDMAAQRHEQRFESARRTARHTAACRHTHAGSFALIQADQSEGPGWPPMLRVLMVWLSRIRAGVRPADRGSPPSTAHRRWRVW